MQTTSSIKIEDFDAHQLNEFDELYKGSIIYHKNMLGELLGLVNEDKGKFSSVYFKPYKEGPNIKIKEFNLFTPAVGYYHSEHDKALFRAFKVTKRNKQRFITKDNLYVEYTLVAGIAWKQTDTSYFLRELSYNRLNHIPSIKLVNPALEEW